MWEQGAHLEKVPVYMYNYIYIYDIYMYICLDSRSSVVSVFVCI